MAEPVVPPCAAAKPAVADLAAATAEPPASEETTTGAGSGHRIARIEAIRAASTSQITAAGAAASRRIASKASSTGLGWGEARQRAAKGPITGK